MGCTDDCPPLGGSIIHHANNAEVSKLNVTLLVDIDVGTLYVSVYHANIVKCSSNPRRGGGFALISVRKLPPVQ
ncbi:hypothetical protein KC349_g124 [Hortaea werneckii]|nr:hypothetical protein KC349_g124 [Hortaea werneckii]